MIASESREFAGVLRFLRQPAPLGWPVDYSLRALWRERRVLLVANGPGPKLAGEALDVAHRQEDFNAVISTGFCGGLDPALQAGGIFVARRVEAVERSAGYEASMPLTSKNFASGTLISADRFVGTIEEKRRLRAAGGSAVDMEAGEVASHACAWGKPFFCIRVVTDTANDGFTCDFNAMRDARGRFSRPRILVSALRRPFVALPEVLQLAWRSRSAALTLGDFLDDCRF